MSSTDLSAHPLVDPEYDVNELIEAARVRSAQHLSRRDRRAASLIGAAFVAAAVLTALLIESDRSPSPLIVVLLVLAYAVASRVEFEVGTGAVLPTELVLVPMLFLLPIGMVPLWVALALVLGQMPEHLSRRIPPDRLLLLLVNSWHSVGPVLVLGLAGEEPVAWRHWPLYLAALGAQFAFDAASSGLRERLALGVPFGTQLRFFRWAFLVDAILAPVGLAAVFASQDHDYAFLLVLPLIGLLAISARERQAHVDSALELGQAYRRTAFLLGEVVESNDAYTGLHSRQVVSLALEVSALLGLDPHERRMAEFAALLHDVGKIRIAPEIINKAGPLTEEEWKIVRRHTLEGELILSRVGGLLAEVGSVVRSSHERFDGGGYPDGLSGEAIPLAARIIACCDALSAMVTDRPYRAALSPEKAVHELRTNSGGQFDPRIVQAVETVVDAEGQSAVLLGVQPLGRIGAPEPQPL